MDTKNHSDILKNTLIFDTGLIEKEPKILDYFNKNNIFFLADLFKKDNEKKIILSNKTKYERYIKSFIILARCKYLKEPLFFNIEHDVKYKKEQWLYSNNGNDAIVYKITYLGFDIKEILISIQYILKEEFSLDDIFTNDIVINEIMKKNIKNTIKNRIYLISDYLKNEKIKKELSSNKTNLKNVLKKEKKLIMELNQLNKQKDELYKRISKIQENNDTPSSKKVSNNRR